MKKIVLKNKNYKKFNKGYLLIKHEDVAHPDTIELGNQREWVSFVNESNQFIGYGYLGEQNKGMGWLVSFKENQPLTSEFLANMMDRAFHRRQDFFNDPETTAFRLFNGEGDGLGGVTIEWYNGYIVYSWYNDTIYSMKSFIIQAVEASLTGIKGSYEKVRFKSNYTIEESSFLSGEIAPEPLLIKENGVTYATYLNEGLMTGIFLDQKDVRKRLVNGLVKGKTVLNTFSYTGAFSVASKLGGATETTSVDLAKRSLPKTEEQFKVNDLSLSSNRIIVMDVFEYFKYASRKNMMYDVVILDPPSFARNKKKRFTVAKDYQALTTEATEILLPKGHLIASTNAANVSMVRFKQMVENGMGATNREYQLIDTYRLPSDFSVSEGFKEGNYLKVLIYQVH